MAGLAPLLLGDPAGPHPLKRDLLVCYWGAGRGAAGHLRVKETGPRTGGCRCGRESPGILASVFPPGRARRSDLLPSKTSRMAPQPGEGLAKSGSVLPAVTPSRKRVCSLSLPTGKQALQQRQVGERGRDTAYTFGRCQGRGSPCVPPPRARLPWSALPRLATPAPWPGPWPRPLPAGLPAVCTGSNMIGELGGRG